MSEWSPPSVPREWLAAAVVLYGLLLAYGVLIAGQLLLTVFPGLFAVGLYLTWRFIVAVEAIADAQQRMADRDTGGQDLDEGDPEIGE